MFAKPTYDASASANINFGPGPWLSACLPVCPVTFSPPFCWAELPGQVISYVSRGNY